VERIHKNSPVFAFITREFSQNKVPAKINYRRTIYAVLKNRSPHFCNKKQLVIKSLAAKHKVKTGNAHNVSSINFQNGSPSHEHKPGDSITIFVSCLINNSLLYTPDQTSVRRWFSVVLSNVSKIHSKWSSSTTCLQKFISLLAPKHLNSYRLFY